MQHGFDDEVVRWYWDQASPGSMVNVTELKPGRIELRLALSVGLTIDGMCSMTIWVSSDDPGALDGLCELVRTVVDRSPVWFGFVAVGRDGFVAPDPRLREYGPVVVGPRTGMDLEAVVDGSLVDVADASAGRRVLAWRRDGDLVEAVRHIRRICWPTVRGSAQPRRPKPGTLGFEGRPLAGRDVGRVYNLLSRAIWERVESWGEPGLVPSITGEIEVVDGGEHHETRGEHLAVLVEGWKRLATGLTVEADHGPSGLVEISLRDDGDRYVIEHGPCDPSAHDALISVLSSPHWPTLFKYPTAPVETRTAPA